MRSCKQASDSKFELTIWCKTQHPHTHDSKFQPKPSLGQTMWHCKQASDSKFKLTLWWKTLHSHTNESKFQHKLCSGLSRIQARKVFDDEGVGIPSDLRRRISSRPILTWGFASLGLRTSPPPPSSWFTSRKIYVPPPANASAPSSTPSWSPSISTAPRSSWVSILQSTSFHSITQNPNLLNPTLQIFLPLSAALSERVHTSMHEQQVTMEIAILGVAITP
jgi:hypothetical protein